MADCDSPTLSVPDLTCAADILTWATTLVAAMQAALDHIVGCVQDVEIPQCDGCALKDDFVICPLTVNMIDFSDVAYDTDGDVGVLPFPPSIAGYAFRAGTGITSGRIDQGTWAPFSITFDEPFDTECLHVSIMPTGISGEVPGCSCEGDPISMLNGIYVLTRTITGCTGYIAGDEFDCQAYVEFTYLAVGN